jgi:crotonobetainyl-CoA:carnitine CoA-transferase CaiB-like acyl-CoA transferase
MGPLAGIRILEPGQLVAAPFASSIMADFGAEVIKTELPGTGDPARGLGPFAPDGSSIWWKTLSRNKKSVTLNLRKAEGQALFKRLVKDVDVVLENFRPGVMDGWGLGWEVLREINPKLIMVRQSGFGQDGPYARRPAYGMIVEAYGGMTGNNRYFDAPPVIAGLCDHIAGLSIAYAVTFALYHRDVHGGGGQLIDNAAAENVLRVAADPGITAARMGITYAVGRGYSKFPSWPAGALKGIGVFETSDGRYVTLHSGTQGTWVWENFMTGMGRADFLDEAPYPKGSEERKARGQEIERAVRDFFASHTRDEIIALAEQWDTTIAPIQDMQDILVDPQFAHRGALVEVADEEMGPLTMVDAVPRMSETPGAIRWAGPPLGAHNQEIYQGLLGMCDAELAALRDANVI